MLIATKIAMEYRQKYAKDVFIEQHCFRRWGHNELDDPTMTNPLLYKQITNRQSVPDAYVETLKDNVTIDNEVVKNHSAMLNDHFKQIETYQVTFLYLKFIYSEKATKFCKISTLLLSYVMPVKRWRFCKILWPSQNI